MVAAIIIVSVLSAIVVVLAIIMLAGHGAGLIAGYNTLSKEEKEKLDKTKLSKFLGKILLPIGLLINGITVGIVYKIQWLGLAVAMIIVILIIFAGIYCNTGNRFKQQ